MGLMKHLSGKKLDAAYEYLNWYSVRLAGRLRGRYGYYSPVPSTAKKIPHRNGVGLLVRRQAGTARFIDPYGVPMEKAGDQARRRLVPRRASTNISCWNTLYGLKRSYMTHKRWNDFKDSMERLAATDTPVGGRPLQIGRTAEAASSKRLTALQQWALGRHGMGVYVSPLVLVLVPFSSLRRFFVVASGEASPEHDGFGGMHAAFHTRQLCGSVQRRISPGACNLSTVKFERRPHLGHGHPGASVSGLPISWYSTSATNCSRIAVVSAVHGSILDL
jgi:hypothetical protein